MDQPLAISIEEAGRLLGISRGLAYQMAKRGDLPTVSFGRRRMVPRKALEQMLEEKVRPGTTD